MFDVQESSRQGSMWGIDPLITDLRNQNCGAYMGYLFIGIYAQADNVGLVATSKADLQSIINRCYSLSHTLRYIIHPQKSKSLLWVNPRNGEMSV